MKDPWDHGHDDPFGIHGLPGMGDDWIKDRFIDPDKMAERKEVTDARIEGWVAGTSAGFSRGLAIGILCTALFFSIIYTAGKVLG